MIKSIVPYVRLEVKRTVFPNSFLRFKINVDDTKAPFVTKDPLEVIKARPEIITFQLDPDLNCFMRLNQMLLYIILPELVMHFSINQFVILITETGVIFCNINVRA